MVHADAAEGEEERSHAPAEERSGIDRQLHRFFEGRENSQRGGITGIDNIGYHSSGLSKLTCNTQ